MKHACKFWPHWKCKRGAFCTWSLLGAPGCSSLIALRPHQCTVFSWCVRFHGCHTWAFRKKATWSLQLYCSSIECRPTWAGQLICICFLYSSVSRNRVLKLMQTRSPSSLGSWSSSSDFVADPRGGRTPAAHHCCCFMNAAKRLPTEVDGGTSGEGFKEFGEHDELESMKFLTLREMCRNKDISMTGSKIDVDAYGPPCC